MADGKGRQTRVTIKAVALEAGVSVAAVSKVLRDAYGVSDALRAKVQAAIDKLGYRPNMAARSLRGRTGAIGVLLLDLHNTFLAEIVDGVHDAALSSGMKVMIGVSRANAFIETSLIESMMDFRLDGLILVAPRLPNATIDMLARQIPIVAIAHYAPGAATFDTVNADDRLGGRQAVEALIAAGYDDIGMVSIDHPLDDRSEVYDLREEGYVAAMQAAGLGNRVRIDVMPDEPEESHAEMEAWLRAPDRPRAVFFWSDLHAILAKNLAHALGIRVPEDLAIVGFDNTRAAAMPVIDLASIDQAGQAQGRLAATMLIERIEGRTEAAHRSVPTRLVRRGSL